MNKQNIYFFFNFIYFQNVKCLQCIKIELKNFKNLEAARKVNHSKPLI